MKKLLHALDVANIDSGVQRGALGRKLLFPISGGMAVLFFVLAGAAYWQYEVNYGRQNSSELAAAAKLYQYTMTDYQATMSGIVDILTSDARVPDMLRNRDRSGLLALYKDAFITVRLNAEL